MDSLCRYSNDLPEDPHINKLLGALTEKPGFGTSCMEGEPITWVSRRKANIHLGKIYKSHVRYSTLKIYIKWRFGVEYKPVLSVLQGHSLYSSWGWVVGAASLWKCEGPVRQRQLVDGVSLSPVWVQLWRTQEDASRVSCCCWWTSTTSGWWHHTIRKPKAKLKSSRALSSPSSLSQSKLIMPHTKKMLMNCSVCSCIQMKISEKDTLQNLTGRNISDYLVKTYAKIIGKR